MIETEQENREALPYVLLISNDEIRIDAYTKKLDNIVNIVSTDTISEHMNSCLLNYKPAAIFILFQKGERMVNKSFDPIFSYVSGYNASLGVSGSKAQLSSISVLAKKFDIEGISSVTVGSVTEKVKSALKVYRSNAEKVKKHLERDKDKPPLLLLIGKDAFAADIILTTLDDYFAAEGVIYRPYYTSLTAALPSRLRELDIFPDILIYIQPLNFDKIKPVVNSMCRSYDFGHIPYALVTAESESRDFSGFDRPPDILIDTNKNLYSFGALLAGKLGMHTQSKSNTGTAVQQSC